MDRYAKGVHSGDMLNESLSARDVPLEEFMLEWSLEIWDLQAFLLMEVGDLSKVTQSLQTVSKMKVQTVPGSCLPSKQLQHPSE